jgi:hypothetical protein
MPLTPARTAVRLPNQQEQQKDGLSNANTQKTIKGASHSGDGDPDCIGNQRRAAIKRGDVAIN